MESYKCKDWRELVHDLKKAPDFGIHGTKRANLKSILASESNVIFGHYLFAGKEEKSLPDTEFYRRLFASLSVTMRYSGHYSIEGSQVNFSDFPSILVGINTNTKGFPRSIYADSSSHERLSVNYGYTFPVGHDFIKSCGVSLEGLTLSENNLIDIKSKSSAYMNKLRKRGPVIYEEMYTSYSVERELIRTFMRGLREILNEYP